VLNYFFARLLEIKKVIEGVKRRFYHKREGECNSSFSQGRE